MFEKLPNEIVLEILQKLNVNELIEMCNSDKRIFSICKNNTKYLAKKLLLNIPTNKNNFYIDVPNVDYHEILSFFVKNKLIRDNHLQSLINFQDNSNFVQLLTPNVLNFFIGNGLDIYQYNYLALALLRKQLSLSAVKYLIEDKNVKVDKSIIDKCLYNFDFVKYFVEKDYKISYNTLKSLFTKRTKNTNVNVKIFNYLIKQFKIDKSKVIAKINQEGYNVGNFFDDI